MTGLGVFVILTGSLLLGSLILQFFGIGVTVGVFVGLVVGSIVALRLGEAIVDSLKELVERLAGRRDRVNFELLLQ